MRKLLLFALFATFMLSCEKDANIETPAFNLTQRTCAAQDVLAVNLKEDPSLAKRMEDIERFTEQAIAEKRLVNGVIEIPVVVNVLYRTAAENVSQALIDSQIKVLNDDFNALNADYNTVPALFSGVKANVGIRFVPDVVIRKATTKTSWGTRDAMKSSKKGGIDATSPSTKLNIWVCTIGGGILGYAQFPGGSLATDGVVIDGKYFGVTSNSSAAYPYNLGRTATHEVGHWLNLRHIWGDTTCGNDFVADTPLHNTANYGVPAYPHYSTCTGTPVEMTMNYMDYTDDRGMYMFTAGQKTRSMALFASGGARVSFAQP